MKGGDGVRHAGVIMYDDAVVVDIYLINRSKEVFAMAKPEKGKSKKMKIKVNTIDGEIDVKGNDGEEPDELSEEESKEIYKNPSTEHIGEILFTHSSPG
jgi:hypothetical protein